MVMHAWTRRLARAVEELKADAEKLIKSMEGSHILCSAFDWLINRMAMHLEQNGMLEKVTKFSKYT